MAKIGGTDYEPLYGLSRFAARFAKRLFKRHPEWRQCVAAADTKWQDGGDLAVRVPSRFAPHAPLTIDTMGDEVIVGWGFFHHHFDSWHGEYTEDEFFEHALEWLEAVMTEKIVIFDQWRRAGGVFGGGSCKPEELEKCLVDFAKEGPVTARSWLGTYDRGHFEPSKL